jgi:hypothetical protein
MKILGGNMINVILNGNIEKANLIDVDYRINFNIFQNEEVEILYLYGIEVKIGNNIFYIEKEAILETEYKILEIFYKNKKSL